MPKKPKYELSKYGSFGLNFSPTSPKLSWQRRTAYRIFNIAGSLSMRKIFFGGGKDMRTKFARGEDMTKMLNIRKKS
jgi:hypothetical protein